MTLLSGENINKQYDDQIIFRSLSFSVGDNDRIGLVGPNGIGKTTLFDIMAGRISPDSGQIVKPKKCLIDYVEQEMVGYDDIRLFDYVCSARQDLIDMKTEIDMVAHKLEGQPESVQIVEKLGELQHRFELEGGYELEYRLKTILLGLGFAEDRFGSKFGSFSAVKEIGRRWRNFWPGRETFFCLTSRPIILISNRPSGWRNILKSWVKHILLFHTTEHF